MAEKKGNLEKKRDWKKCVASIIYLAICFGIGIIIGNIIGNSMGTKAEEGRGLGESIALFAMIFLWVIVCFYIHIIVHEAGHFVFGLKSGYNFSSFRVFSFMWIKEDGKIRFKRFNLAGTGGQCLMIPPELKDGRIPVMLYNLGGVIMNIIFAVLASVGIIISVFLAGTIKNPFVYGLIIFALVGLAVALMNGIPLKTGGINNDGHNALTLRNDKEAMYAFWLQLKMNAEIAKGVRLGEMPEEWFKTPSDEAMKNSLVATTGVFVCNRLMEEHKFEEADKLMEHLLAIESGIVEIHRNLLICDRIYCEIMGENRRDIIDGMYTKELKKFMKTMKKFPTVIRTEYAYALGVEKDEKKAEEILAFYDKYMKVYPYKSDAESERELIELVREKAGHC